MEKENQEHIDKIRQAMPAKEASASVIMNGIGNGMMIGTIPFVALELYSHIADKKIPKSAYVANAFATVAGCTLGAYMGKKEADRLRNFRQSLVDEVAGLRSQLDENCAQINSWADKIRQDDPPQDKTTAR